MKKNLKNRCLFILAVTTACAQAGQQAARPVKTTLSSGNYQRVYLSTDYARLNISGYYNGALLSKTEGSCRFIFSGKLDNKEPETQFKNYRAEIYDIEVTPLTGHREVVSGTLKVTSDGNHADIIQISVPNIAKECQQTALFEHGGGGVFSNWSNDDSLAGR